MAKERMMLGKKGRDKWKF